MPLNGTFGNASAKASGNAGNLEASFFVLSGTSIGNTDFQDQFQIDEGSIYTYDPGASTNYYITKISKFGHIVFRKNRSNGNKKVGSKRLAVGGGATNQTVTVHDSNYDAISWQLRSNTANSNTYNLEEDTTNNFLYIVTNQNGGTIHKHNLSTGAQIASFQIVTGFGAASQNISNIAIDSSNNIYLYGQVTSTYNSTHILKLDSSLNILAQKVGTFDSANNSSPSSGIIDSNENFVYSSSGTSAPLAIVSMTPSLLENVSTALTSSLGNLSGAFICSDSFGDIYISTRLASSLSTVYIIKIDGYFGTITWQIKVSGYTNKPGIRVDSENVFLYGNISNGNNMIVKIPLSGISSTQSFTYSGTTVSLSNTTEISQSAFTDIPTTNSSTTLSSVGAAFSTVSSETIADSTAVTVRTYQ